MSGHVSELCRAVAVWARSLCRCLEMQDSEQPSSCACGPYELVEQTKSAAKSNNIGAAFDGVFPTRTPTRTYATYTRAPACCMSDA